jgi:hypothetical protein
MPRCRFCSNTELRLLVVELLLDALGHGPELAVALTVHVELGQALAARQQHLERAVHAVGVALVAALAEERERVALAQRRGGRTVGFSSGGGGAGVVGRSAVSPSVPVCPGVLTTRRTPGSSGWRGSCGSRSHRGSSSMTVR